MKADPIDRLIEKYPDLFSEDGKQISSCPEGWERIVDGFCAFLAAHQASYRTAQTKCLRNVLINLLVPIFKWLELCFRPKGQPTVLWVAKKQKKQPFTLSGFFRRVWLKLSAKKKFHKVYPPKTQIDQVKEKFGGLRIYPTCHDEAVSGAIHMAEKMCENTCEDTGNVGALCKRGCWYKTLSLDKAQELGYTPIKKQDV